MTTESESTSSYDKKQRYLVFLKVLVLGFITISLILLGIDSPVMSEHRLALASSIYVLIFMYSNLLRAETKDGAVALRSYKDLAGNELIICWLAMFLYGLFL